MATLGAGTRKVVRYLAVRARQRPLETTAVVLIGLGGAVYPPVWLLGAVLALASRVWDARDKWLGLVIPVFVVIVGMGADVSLSGTRPGVGAYFREAWIFGGHLSRVVAVLGAMYLTWRLQQPRRQQSAEPWKKGRRFT
jgi:predicted outer membrane lipoprotein